MIKIKSILLLGAMLFCVLPIHSQVPQIINFQGRIAVGNVNYDGQGKFKFALVSGGTTLSSNAVAVPTVVNGFLVGISVSNGGAGYISVPSVSISDSTGSGAIATASISGGAVVSVTIQNAGHGYTSSPLISIAPPAQSTAFTSFWSNDGTSSAGGEPVNWVTLPITKGLYSVPLGDSTLSNMVAIPYSTFTNSDVRLRVWFNDGTNGFQMLSPDQRIAAVGYAMTAGNVSDGAITASKFAPGALNSALQSNGLSGVASGGMILSTNSNASNLLASGYVKVGQLDSSQQEWRPGNSDDAPSARQNHTAVWTGTEMIIWGGYNNGSADYFNSGGRYNPQTDSWIPTSTNGAPKGRYSQAAVWTGTRMLIWGGIGITNGDSVALQTGAQYNLTTDSWSSISTNGAPYFVSQQFSYVWTGSQLVVFGAIGYDNQNGLYIFGGAKYDPTADAWSPVSTNGAPLTSSVTSFVGPIVWTGTEIVVWGGYNSGPSGVGGRYNPQSDSWTSMTANGSPSARSGHSAVWIGNELVIWGGYGNPSWRSDGGKYNPSEDKWRSISLNGAPSLFDYVTAVWTGKGLLFWGRSFGGSSESWYNPVSNQWTSKDSASPPMRANSTTIWTGTEMLIFGGNSGIVMSSLYRYKPAEPIFLYAKP
jgi:N-acetylneuraminic acid mutarotase